MRFLLKSAVLVALGISFGQIIRGDTLFLRSSGSEINGKVTYSEGVFHIVAKFADESKKMSFKRSEVSEVRFNNHDDNPAFEFKGWSDKSNSAPYLDASVSDVLTFWEPKDKRIVGNLETITADSVTIGGKKTPRTEGVRAIKLK
jgi:hypothetical protein